MKAEIFSPGGENAKVVTGLLISALRLVPGAWVAYQGGVLVPVGNHWLRVGLDGEIEIGETT
mgnify:CR=1 FL=1